MSYRITPRAGDPFVCNTVKIEPGGVLYYQDDRGRHYLAASEWTRVDQVAGSAATAPAGVATPSADRIANQGF